MDLSPYVPLMIPATIIAMAIVARVCGDLSTQSEARQDSRICRIERTVSRVAGGIAADLRQAQSAGTEADALGAMKAAAVQEGATYLAGVMPGVLGKAGVTPAALVGMLHGEVGKQTLLAAAPGLLTAVAGVLLPTPDLPAAG